MPSMFPVTPVPALGFPEVVSGGQSVAHSPAHLLVDPLSFSNR